MVTNQGLAFGNHKEEVSFDTSCQLYGLQPVETADRGHVGNEADCLKEPSSVWDMCIVLPCTRLALAQPSLLWGGAST